MANDPADDKMKEMQKSLKAYKGHFIRAITSAERLSKAMTKHEEVVADLVIQSQVHTIHRTQGLVTALLEQLYDLTNEDTYLAGLEDTANRGDEVMDRLLEAKKIAKAHMQQQQQQQKTTAAITQ